jgi:serine/threonine protein kinase
MGVVYLGISKEGSQVAVKVPRTELADDREFRVRFRREVATLTQVKGLCTVKVIEADTDSARPFLVTEYAAGLSLAEYVDAYGPLDADMLYGLATGLAEALAEIHVAGVVHRDFKPSNVILAGSGPKVIDFGIAQTLDSTAVTKTGTTIGSVGYMAPEQIMGRAGPPVDIFAWAVTIGFAASGQPPFGTGASDAILYRILHTEPDIGGVQVRLKPLVQAALAKDPEKRPDARELLGQLTNTPVVADRSYETPTQTVLSHTWQPAVPRVVVPQVSRPARQHKILLSATLSLGLLGAGAVAVNLATQHRGTPHLSGTNHLAASSTATKSASASSTTAPISSPPETARALTNTREAALASLRDRGYVPDGNSPAWDPSAAMNAIIAGQVGSADPAQQVYFFANGRLVGTDADSGSSAVSASRLSGDLIVIHYYLYNTGDARCCPSGGIDSVRFYWTGSHVISMDPVPAASARN